MKTKYDNIRWVVQRNLTSREDLEKMRASFAKTGVDHLEIDIIPFSSTLPEIDQSFRSIYYGSTTFLSLLQAAGRSFFFDEAAFSIENYLCHWGEKMLNHGASVTTFDALLAIPYASDKSLFIRPDDDSKSFAGEVIHFGEIKTWFDRLQTIGNTGLSGNTKIIVSTPYNIRCEWRLWIVEGKVVAASRYREYFRLKKERGCPPEVSAYAEARCREYMPHDVFVMDVCLCGDAYFIVECNCVNGAGFYDADVEEIIGRITKYVAER